VIDKYGVDTTRLCILSNVAPKSERLWSDDGIHMFPEIFCSCEIHRIYMQAHRVVVLFF